MSVDKQYLCNKDTVRFCVKWNAAILKCCVNFVVHCHEDRLDD